MFGALDDFWIFRTCEIEGLCRVRSTEEEGKYPVVAFLFRPGGADDFSCYPLAIDRYIKIQLLIFIM